jgi:predicted nuclease of restriction endonuclease-like (RecB) superfamily
VLSHRISPRLLHPSNDNRPAATRAVAGERLLHRVGRTAVKPVSHGRKRSNRESTRPAGGRRLQLKDPLRRYFYAEMCRMERWTVRTLRAKIGGMLFERTAPSRKPEELVKRELAKLRQGATLSPDLVIRDQYLLDFLGSEDAYSEKHLEAAILREMEQFILELGAGFETQASRYISCSAVAAGRPAEGKTGTRVGFPWIRTACCAIRATDIRDGPPCCEPLSRQLRRAADSAESGRASIATRVFAVHGISWQDISAIAALGPRRGGGDAPCRGAAALRSWCRE